MNLNLAVEINTHLLQIVLVGIGTGALLGAALMSDGITYAIRGAVRLWNKARPPEHRVPADFNTLEELQVQMTVAGWPKLAYLLGCPFCMGVYLTLAVGVFSPNREIENLPWIWEQISVYGIALLTYRKLGGFNH